MYGAKISSMQRQQESGYITSPCLQCVSDILDLLRKSIRYVQFEVVERSNHVEAE